MQRIVSVLRLMLERAAHFDEGLMEGGETNYSISFPLSDSFGRVKCWKRPSGMSQAECLTTNLYAVTLSVERGQLQGRVSGWVNGSHLHLHPAQELPGKKSASFKMANGKCRGICKVFGDSCCVP